MTWKNYRVDMETTEYKTVYVKARTEEEALKKAEQKDWDGYEAICAWEEK